MKSKHSDPAWWNRDHDSAWERVKEAFHRDWQQTKHDFGGDEPDLNQDVDDTVKQAAGSQAIPPENVPNFEEEEQAYRFGYGARRQYGENYREWNDELEGKLRTDWGSEDWDRYRPAVRRGWDYSDMSNEMSRSCGRVLKQ